MQWIMMTNWQQETPENILRLFHERARSIKPILLASDADAISNLLDRLFITGGKGSFVGQVRNESINMLFRTQLHSLPEFLIKRLNQSLLREDVPELAEMIGYYHKYDYEYRFEDWTNKLSADEIRALIKQYVALLLPHANKDTLEFFTRYALNNPEHLLSIYANRRNIDRNITKFSSLMAYMYQYGQVMRDEFLTWLMPQDISIDNEKISISADGLYKIFQITPFTLYELKELLGLVPLDQKASFLYKRIAELMAIEIRNVGIGNNSNVLLDFGDYIIPYLPEDQQPFVRAYIQVNNSLGWRLTQSGGLTYYQQSLAGKSPNEMIATVVQDEMRNGRMLNIDVILLDYLSDEVLALLLPEQKAFLATYKAVPKLQWRFKQPDGFTYYQQSLAGKSPIEMIATVVQDETIKGAIIGNVMSLVQDQAVTNLLPVQVRNFWLAYQHPSITTEEQRRFLALHREQIDKYYQNNEITAMFYKDFAAQDPHGFVRSSDKKAWMVVFGEERIKRLLEVLPTGLADEKRNAFTHNEYDRTSLFFSYATEQLKDNFSLNEQDLDLMIQYIAKFGLSKTISLFYYFKHLTLLEQKRISALPADIQATGITSIAELERRVIAIQEKAFGEQQLMQISELAPFEQEILSLITMHSVHRWTVIPISQLAQNFDQDMQAGAIALLQPEYLPHTISVPLVVVTSDLSTTGECYEGFRREILASLNAPEQISEIRDRIKQIFIWKLEDLRKSADPSKPAFRFIQTQIGQIEPKISLIEQATTIDQLIGILIQEKLSYFGEKDKDLTSLVRELVFRKLFIKHERSEGWREEIRNLLENPISVQSISEVINIVDNYIKDHVLNVQTENADGYWDADTFALLKQYKKKNNLNDLFLSQLNELRTVMANMQIQEQRENLSIELIPDRGLIGEMAGYLGGVCYTKVFPLLKQYPNVTPYKFVARDPQTGEKRLLGSALVFETTDTDGNPVMVIRAFDVRYETSMDIGKFFERFVDALQEVAAKRGIKKILAAGTGGTISNYPMIINYVLSNYVTGKPATTLQNTFNFNTYDITDKVYLVRSLMPAAQSETSSAQAGTTTANNQAANQGFEGGVVQDAQAFEQAWNDNNREQVVISPEHLAVLQGPAMGPTFRTPEVKLVSEVEMAAITGDKYVHVARIENRVLVVTDYWNSLSAGVKLDLLMHEGMEDWMEKNRSTMPAQDIAMALEGFRINEAERRARHLGVSQGDQSVSSVETGVAEDPVEVQGMILNLLAQSNVAQYLSDEVVSRSNGEVGGVLYYQKITYDAEHLIRIAKRSGLTYEALRQILATQLLEACKKYSEKSITKLQLQVIMNRICNKIEVEQHQAPGALDESSLPSQPYTNAVAREVIEPVLTKGEEEVQLRILDVGSGSGIVSVAAASVDRSSHVVGLDPDPGNVRLANRVKQFAGNLDRAGLFDRSGDVETRVEELESSKEVPEPVDNVEFQVGSATQILFGDDSFNRIIYFDVDAFIFSKDDKVKAIQEILRVIDKKKGGVIHARPKASATEKDVQNFIEVFNIEASKLGLKLDHQLTYSTESGRSVLFIIQPSRVPDSRKSERPIAGSPTEAGAREKQRNKEQIKNNIRWPWQRMSLERKIREVYSAQALEAVKKNGGNIIGVGFIGDGFASVTVIRTVSSSGEIKSFALQTRFIGEGRNSAINNQEAFYQLTPENVPRVYYKVQRGGAVGSLGARGVIEVTVTDAIEGDNLWNEMSTLYTGGTSNISREDLRGILYQAGKAVATWHKNKFFHGDFGLGHIRLRGKTPVVIDYDLADTSRQTGYVYADTAALFSHLEMFASFASQEEIRVLKNNFLRGYREVYLDSDREEGIFDREINLVAIIQKSPAMSAEVMPQIFAQGQKLEELLEGRNNIFKRDSIPARLVLNIDGTVKLELISSAASSQTPRTPGDIHTSGSLAGKKADTQQREGGIDSSASLPSASAQSNMGGIDFRFLPIVTQSLDNLKASIRKIPVGSLQRIDLSQEWSDIERLVNAGIIPSAERLKGYLFASCCKGNYDNDAGKMVYCIAEVLRMEEESCSATDPALKDILVVLGSGRSAEELKLAFAN